MRQGGPGRYWWTVAVVELSPYRRTGPEAAPRLLDIGEANSSPGGSPTPAPGFPKPPYRILSKSAPGPPSFHEAAEIGSDNGETADALPPLFMMINALTVFGLMVQRLAGESKHHSPAK